MGDKFSGRMSSVPDVKGAQADLVEQSRSNRGRRLMVAWAQRDYAEAKHGLEGRTQLVIA